VTLAQLTIAAKVAVNLWALATVVVGLLYHFGTDGDRFEPWISPMCMTTLAGAFLVQCLSKRRSIRE
jgi:hypothetical protein